jgi:hypothetical protein
MKRKGLEDGAGRAFYPLTSRYAIGVALIAIRNKQAPAMTTTISALRVSNASSVGEFQ